MNTTLFLPALAAATLLSAAALAAPAAAVPGFASQPVTVTVQLGDLRLEQDRGAEIALRRMTRAAGTACGPSPDSIRTVEYRTQYRYCVRANMDALVREADASRVTALYTANRPSMLLSRR